MSGGQLAATLIGLVIVVVGVATSIRPTAQPEAKKSAKVDPRAPQSEPTVDIPVQRGERDARADDKYRRGVVQPSALAQVA